MGIENLNTIIEKHTKNGKMRRHLSYFSHKTFAIDTNVYLYKYLYGKSNHIDGMFFMINKFKKFNINPIFVFDGKPPEEKQDTIKNRKQIKDKLQERLLNLKAEILLKNDNMEITEMQSEIDNIEKRLIYVNKNIIDKTKELFDLMGIIYVNANCEAEHYCSKLCKMGVVDGVVSEDMDTIACESRLVIRNFTNRDDNVEAYYLDDILYELDISYNSFIDLCILLGNDYNYRPRNLVPETILSLIKEHKCIEEVLKNGVINNWNYDYNAIRDIIKLKDINIDTSILVKQLTKKVNLADLKEFLKNNSNIEEKTYIHRINLMFFQNSKKNDVSKNMSRLMESPYGKNLANISSYNNYTVESASNF